MLVGLAGLGLSIAAIPAASARKTKSRFYLSLVLLTIHLSACIAYYYYAKYNPADSATYYFDTLNLGSIGFGLGAIFTTDVTQFLRNFFGASYLECFVFFQSIGFWGLMILMRSFQEIQLKMGSQEAILPAYLLFLPSLHFWTSAIGKDAPLFFAVSLCVWSSLEWRRRLLPYAFSMIVMVLFRAHIALIVVVSLAAAAVLHPGFSLGRKAGLLIVTLIGVLLLVQSVEHTISVDVTSASSIATFFQERNDIAAKVGGMTTFGDAPVYVRLIALLFRPFFYDTGNILGYVASVENIGSICLFLYFFRKWKLVIFLTRRVFFLEFCFSLSLTMIILLTLVNYNIGVGLRERVMVFPPLFCLFVALWLASRRSVRYEFVSRSKDSGSRLIRDETIVGARL